MQKDQFWPPLVNLGSCLAPEYVLGSLGGPNLQKTLDIDEFVGPVAPKRLHLLCFWCAWSKNGHYKPKFGKTRHIHFGILQKNISFKVDKRR